MLDYFVALLPWDSSKMKMCCQLSLIVIVIIMIHNCVLVSTVESTCRKRIETEAEGRTSQKGEAKRSMASLFRFFSLMEIPFPPIPWVSSFRIHTLSSLCSLNSYRQWYHTL